MNNRISLLLSFGIAIIQVVDIIIHVATNQAEPIRIAANIIILLWLVITSPKYMIRRNAVITIGFYLFLNLIFLATNGVTNAAQGGGLRVPLLVLVALTVILSIVLTAFWERQLRQLSSRAEM